MKTLHYIFAAMGSVLLLCSFNIDQTAVVHFESTNQQFFDVLNVERTETSTVLTVQTNHSPNCWCKLTNQMHLEADGKEYKLQKSEGFELDKEVYMPASGRMTFRLFFEPLSPDADKFDLFNTTDAIRGITVTNEPPRAEYGRRQPSRAENIVWQQPEILTDNLTDQMKIESVEFADTATIVRFLHHGAFTGEVLCPEAYLMGDDGRRCAALDCSNEKLEASDGEDMRLTVFFEPMPDDTKAIDYRDNESLRFSFYALGIHNASEPLEIKPFEMDESELAAARRGFFHTDTVCIQGYIEGYDPKAQGQVYLTYRDVLKSVVPSMDGFMPKEVAVRDDGTFTKKLVLPYPMVASVRSNVFRTLSLYLVPGETLNIRIHNDRTYDISSPSGKEPACLKFMLADPKLNTLFNRVHMPDGKDEKSFLAYCNALTQRRDYELDMLNYMAQRLHFSSMDYFLLNAETRLTYANEIFFYQSNHRKRGASQERNIWSDPENYGLWREAPHNDILAMSCPAYDAFMSHYENSYLFRKCWVERDKKGGTVQNRVAWQRQMEMDKRIFQSDSVSLPEQIILMRRCEGVSLDHSPFMSPKIEKHIFESAMANVTQPKLKTLLLSMYGKHKHRREQSYFVEVLPDNEAVGDLRKITDQYAGKVVLLDFWGCWNEHSRSIIERGEKARKKLVDSPDIKFVFIANEKDNDKREYDEYVAEHLRHGHTVLVPDDEFRRYKQLFNFNEEPHLEVLDRQGRRVRIQIPDYKRKDDLLYFVKQIDSMQE